MAEVKKQTYKQLTSEIEKLQKQAEQARKEEVAGVIARMQDAIKAYGLTPADLGFTTAKTPKISKAKKSSKQAAGTNYADGNGNVWGGRGPRPAWLRAALDAGKKLEDFKAK